MRLGLIDNYDSFTWNLVHAFGVEGVEVDVIRNDAMSAAEFLARGADAIVLSPGPCTPNEAGISLETVWSAAGKVPVFGVCLGHQAIGQAFGGIIRRATPMHGKISTIRHEGTGLFRGLNAPLKVTRYHSLVIENGSLPEVLRVTARCEEGLIMAVQHREAPIFGVQFHPESIATEQGALICRNFLSEVRAFRARPRAA
jgi:anthranilate synthase component 2